MKPFKFGICSPLQHTVNTYLPNFCKAIICKVLPKDSQSSGYIAFLLFRPKINSNKDNKKEIKKMLYISHKKETSKYIHRMFHYCYIVLHLFVSGQIGYIFTFKLQAYCLYVCLYYKQIYLSQMALGGTQKTINLKNHAAALKKGPF